MKHIFKAAMLGFGALMANAAPSAALTVDTCTIEPGTFDNGPGFGFYDAALRNLEIVKVPDQYQGPFSPGDEVEIEIVAAFSELDGCSLFASLEPNVSTPGNPFEILGGNVNMELSDATFDASGFGIAGNVTITGSHGKSAWGLYLEFSETGFTSEAESADNFEFKPAPIPLPLPGLLLLGSIGGIAAAKFRKGRGRRAAFP